MNATAKTSRPVTVNYTDGSLAAKRDAVILHRAVAAARVALRHRQSPVCAAYRAVSRMMEDGTNDQILEYASQAQAIAFRERGMNAKGEMCPLNADRILSDLAPAALARVIADLDEHPGRSETYEFRTMAREYLIASVGDAYAATLIDWARTCQLPEDATP